MQCGTFLRESRGRTRELRVQRFDRRQGDAVFADRGDVLIIFADAEGCVEILRHRADVAHAALGEVTPCGDRQGRDFVEHRCIADRCDLGFERAIAGAGPRAHAAGYTRLDVFGVRLHERTQPPVSGYRAAGEPGTGRVQSSTDSSTADPPGRELRAASVRAPRTLDRPIASKSRPRSRSAGNSAESSSSGARSRS